MATDHSPSIKHRLELLSPRRADQQWLGDTLSLTYHHWVADILVRSKLSQRLRLVRTETCLLLATGQEISALNESYRGIPRETNVLAFPSMEWLEDGSLSLGDLVICPKIVRKEAKAQGKSTNDHFLHLLLHGMLHLFGYDHQTARQARTMESRETAMLEKIGISNPYMESDS